ncbi:MAG: PilZ domain-containing protein [Pseudorhodoplanes sp.]
MRRYDNRKFPRKPLRYPATIETSEDASALCMISDVSDTGARLIVDQVDNVPEDFVLHLTRDGRTRRKCHVIWRSENQVGIEFQKDVQPPQPVFLKRPAGSR